MIKHSMPDDDGRQRAWGRNCPEFGSMSSLGVWIRDHETLLATHFLRLLVERPAKVHACGIFVSQLRDGRLCLRLCEGDNARWLNWKARSVIDSGDPAQAAALEQLWISMREALGFELLWSLSRNENEDWRVAGTAFTQQSETARETLNA